MLKYNLTEIEVRSFIDGQYKETNGGFINKFSPIDGAALPALHACSIADVDVAVESSNQCFLNQNWSHLSTKEKKDCLLRFADCIERDTEYLAFLNTIETGRAYGNLLNDSIPKAIKCLRWFAECADKLHGQCITPSQDRMCLITNEPLGVLAAVLPWNDPLVVAVWKLAPALLMGNSIIIKPSEYASYPIIRLGFLANMAGIPRGVLNILPGHGHITGNALANHQTIKGIFFTGSSIIGKKIMSVAGSSNMKRVGLECGGKSAYIVTSKCSDVSAAVKTLAKNMFYNQGQVCSAPSRLILDKKLQTIFMRKLLEEIKIYEPADPWKKETIVGSICSKIHYESILGFIQRAENEGINRITKSSNPSPYPNGYYLSPTIFIDVPPYSEIAQNEIFGPVLVVHIFDKLEEAIQIANGTRFGLAASIWSDDLNESMLYSQKLEAGIVHINSFGEDDESAPFGGIKESGIGKDKSMMVFGEYSNLKTTWIQFKKQH